MTEDCPHITVQRKGAVVMTEDCPHITVQRKGASHD